MSDYASSHRSHEPTTRKTSASAVGWIVLAALLCGSGLFLLAYFIAFLTWWAFSGVLLVILGFLVLLRTWTGPESA